VDFFTGNIFSRTFLDFFLNPGHFQDLENEFAIFQVLKDAWEPSYHLSQSTVLLKFREYMIMINKVVKCNQNVFYLNPQYIKPH